MTRNQKIALGCGGAGCLGLIVVVMAAGLMYFFYQRSTPGRNSNIYTNRNSNINTNENDNSDSNTNDNTNSSNSSSSSVSSMSDDDKHKLYQAAAMTGDGELLQRVSVKLGLMDENFTPGERYSEFLTEHVGWVLRNGSFIQSINTAEKARAYVDQNIPD